MPRPADVSRRINAERIVLLGWVRALLLQLAHPLIAAGVAEHSTFRGSTRAAFARLHQTIAAMLSITFGDAAERDRALDGIRAIHRRVHGVLPERVGALPAGTPYSAEDPALLLWVHVTLVESIVLTYEQLFGPLTAAERDSYCADSADVAIELGARADEVPRTWAALRACIERAYEAGSIAVGPQARTLASALLAPFGTAIVDRIVTPAVSLLAAGQLPAHIRTQYGLSWNRRRARRFRRMLRLVRFARRLMPARVALWKSARSANCYPVSHGHSAAAR